MGAKSQTGEHLIWRLAEHLIWCLAEQRSVRSQGWDRQRLHLHPGAEVSAPLTSGRPYFISWRGTHTHTPPYIFIAVSCPRGGRRGGGTGIGVLSHTSPALQLLKLPRRARTGLLLLGRGCRSGGGDGVTGALRLEKVIQGNVLQDPGQTCLLCLGQDGVRDHVACRLWGWESRDMGCHGEQNASHP